MKTTAVPEIQPVNNMPKNPQAFPRPYSIDPSGGEIPDHHKQQDGMTLRDYFAAKAMQGLISTRTRKADEDIAIDPNQLSSAAYDIADAMLAARSK